MNAYFILLQSHSGLRWIVLLLSVVLIIKSLVGLFGGGQFQKIDNILSASYVGTVHLQVLTGLVLYFFLSPIAAEARGVGFGSMMSDGELRFWGMEHFLVMVLAAIAAQIGRSISKKAEDASVKFRFQAIFYGVSLLLILIGIPWDRM